MSSSKNLEGVASGHLVPLPGSAWRVWRWTCLRGPGFPATFVRRLVATDAAATADEVSASQERFDRAREAALEALIRELAARTGDEATALREATKLVRKGRVPAETGTAADEAIRTLRGAAAELASARSRFLEVFEASRMTVLDAARALAREPRLREAITWQNRAVIRTGLDSFAHSEGKTSRICRNEDLVASYLQRYATKNDSIGFFGPIGWSHFETTGPALVARPGPQLLASRSVHFEQWPIDAIASKVASDPRFAPWMIPRRFPFVRVTGTTAASPVNGRHELTPEQVLVLAACDGEATAKEVAASLAIAHPGLLGAASRVFDALGQLREAKLIAWTFELPLTWDADRVLRGLLERIDDDALREEALRPLVALDAARKRVAESAGDAAVLAAALGELEGVFTGITGLAPTRQAGTMYAARQLVFEDCRRDVDVAIGPDVLARIAPALTLTLTSARWLTFEVGKAYGAQFRGLYEDLARRAGSPSVSFSDLWLRAQRLLFGVKDKPVAAIVAELQARWARVLAVPAGVGEVRRTSRELEAGVNEEFAAPRPGWVGARYQAPDILIAATSVEAVCRGDYEVVLGELHVATNTVDACSFFSQHPHPEQLTEAFARDIPEPFVRPINPKDWPKATARTLQALVSPSTLSLESGFDRGRGARDRTVATGDLVVDQLEGELFVLTPRGDRIALIEVFGDLLSKLVAAEFRILPEGEHTPRVTIDQLVVSREAWSILPSTFDFADAADEASRFLGARRWAQSLGIPRFVFAKTELEEKPVYVDFDAPAFVNMLAKLVRRAREQVGGEKAILIAEMLPTLDQTWLEDAAGDHYTAELRLICVDGAR